METAAATSFLHSVRRLAEIPAERLTGAWEWPAGAGEVLAVRDLGWRLIESELSAAAATRPQGEVQAALAGAQAAWGGLRGLLAGFPDRDLDREPAPGEWPLSQVLAHVLLVELRYRAHCLYAAARDDADPVYVTPEVGADEKARSTDEWISRLDSARAETDRALASIPAAVLDRPAVWAGHTVTLRFRITRFTGHLAEHALHAEKTITALGGPLGEPRRLAMLLSEARGRHEHLSSPQALQALDAAAARLLDSLR